MKSEYFRIASPVVSFSLECELLEPKSQQEAWMVDAERSITETRNSFLVERRLVQSLDHGKLVTNSYTIQSNNSTVIAVLHCAQELQAISLLLGMNVGWVEPNQAAPALNFWPEIQCHHIYYII